MALNQTSTPFLPTSLLVADLTKFTGTTGAQATSPDSVPTLTINPTTQLPVSAALEVQSTTGLLLVPRLTDAEYTALITTVVPRPQVGAVPDPGNVINGMIYYNSDDENFVFFQNGAPVILPTGGGLGNVVGVNVVVSGTLAMYTNPDGLLIDQTSVGNLGGFNVLASELVVCGASGTANQVATYTGTAQTGNTGAIIQAATVTMSAGGIANVTTIQNALGTVSLPSYTFTAHTNTGIFSAAGASVDVAVGGAAGLKVLSTAVQFPDGTAALPAITFLSETDTGMYRIGANTVGFGANGGTNFSVAGTIATSATYLTAAGAAATGTATASIATLTATSTDTNASISFVPKGIGQVLNVNGAVATPAYSFAADTNTGIYRVGAEQLGFAANGVLNFQVNAASVNVPVGAVGTPGIGFLTDVDTGLWHQAANTIGFAAAGGNQFSVTGAGVTNNWLQATGVATGSSPSITALGTADAAVSISLVHKGAAAVAVKSSDITLPGTLSLLEGSTNGVLSVNIAAPANVTASYTLTLPATYVGSANNQALTITSGGGTAAMTLGFANTSGILSASGTILVAAARAAYTTPISLVAAAGASTIIIIERITVEFVGASPFVGSGDFIIEYGNVAHGTGPAASGSILNASFVGLSASTILFSNPTVASIGVAGATNLGVFLSATGGADFTGGGALNYTVQYYIINVT